MRARQLAIYVFEPAVPTAISARRHLHAATLRTTSVVPVIAEKGNRHNNGMDAVLADRLHEPSSL